MYIILNYSLMFLPFPTGCDLGTLSNPANGIVAITTAVGELTAIYTCDVGYKLMGDAMLTCQSNGQFSGEEPQCDGVWKRILLQDISDV